MRTDILFRQWPGYSRGALSFFHQSTTVPEKRFFSTAQLVVGKQQQLKEFKPYIEQTMLHDVVETRTAHQRFLGELRKHVLQAYRSSSLFQLRHSELHPTVFISYAWCLENLYPWEWWTQPFLVRFAMDLYQLGFDPRLDIMHSRFGPSSIEYMMRELDRADLVFPIGTRSLNTKMVGDEYFQSAIRYEMRMISERKVRCAKSGQTDGVMPLQLTGDDVALVFPSNYPQHTVIESFQQPNTSYLMMLCELVKYAYHHFSGTSKLDITKAMTNSEAEDGGGRLCSLIDSAKVTSPLSTHFHRLSDEVVQRYYESCTSEAATVKQQWLHNTMLFMEQSQQVKPLNANEGHFNKPSTAVSLHLQMGQDAPYSQLTHQSALKAKSWCYQLPELYASFVPRSSYFGQLAERLHDRSFKVGSTIVVLYGLGGVGKTQLASYALAHAETFGQRSSYPLKAWFRASSAEQLQMSYMQFAEEFGIPLDDKQSLIERAIIVREWLEAFEGGFLVYDNVSEEKQIAELLPSKGHYQIVVTSRNAHWSLGSSIAIDVMSAREAEQLVIQVCRYSEVTEEVTNLVELLGYLPLALMQAAAYIKATNCSVAHYLALYHQYQAEMLLEMAEEGWPRGVEYCDADGKPQPIWTTFNINFIALQEKEPGALQLLEHCAYLHHQAIPVELLQGLVLQLEEGKQPTKPAPLQVDKYIRALRTYSLVQVEPSLGIINIHQLMQDILRYEVGKVPDKSGSHLNRLGRIFYEKFHDMDNIKKKPHQHAAWFLNGETAINHIEIWWAKMNLPISKDASHLYACLGNISFYIGEFKKAIIFYKKQLIIQEKFHDDFHTDTGVTIANIGNVMTVLGELHQARDCYLKAMTIQEKHYGKENFTIAQILNNLGNVCRELGEFYHARDFLERALSITEKSDQITLVAPILTTLANVLREIGQFDRAKIYLENALTITEKIYGKNHLETASILNGLGTILLILGNPNQAKIYHERTLLIRKNFYGKGHIETARTLVDLGIALSELDEPKQAKEHYEKALVIQEEFYHKGHIETASTIANLANIHMKLGELSQAKIYYEQTLSIQINFHGKDNIMLAHTYKNMALLFRKLGESDLELANLKKALAIEEQFYQKGNPKIIDTVHRLGNLLKNLGESEQARVYLQRALLMQKDNAVWINNETASILDSLGTALLELGEYHQAEMYLKEALNIMENLHGRQHIKTASYMGNLGNAFMKLGELQKAKTCYEQVLEMQEKTYGKEKIETATVLGNIGSVFESMKEYSKARCYFERSLSIQREHYGYDHPRFLPVLTNLVSLETQLGNTDMVTHYQARINRLHRKGPPHPFSSGCRSYSTLTTFSGTRLMPDSQQQLLCGNLEKIGRVKEEREQYSSQAPAVKSR